MSNDHLLTDSPRGRETISMIPFLASLITWYCTLSFTYNHSMFYW